jgi:hypoxanthine-guanine phosphoribosyltransferase
MDADLLASLTALSAQLSAKLPALQLAVASHNEVEDSAVVSAERTAAVLAASNIAPAWSSNIKEVLFTPHMIQSKVAELGARISKEYAGKKVLCVGLLSGAVVFMADLMRHIGVEYEIDFMTLSSYGNGTSSSGSVKIKKDLSIDPCGKHVIIVEDLIDTGACLAHVHSSTRPPSASAENSSVELHFWFIF